MRGVLNPLSTCFWICGFIAVVFFSCKRSEPTSWDADVKGPLAYGRLSLENIVADSLLLSDESGLWHLMLDENLTDFDLDSIVEIPDTSIVKQYPLFIVGDFPQGFALPISPTQEIKIQHPSVQLKEVRMKSGLLKYRLHSPVDGYLNCTFHIPGLTLNGVPQSILLNTEPPANGEDFVAEGELDLSGYDLNLTGESGSSFNRIAASFDVIVDPNADLPAHVSQGDALELELEFVDPKLSYARGFFGTHFYQLDEDIDFTAVAHMPDGVLNLEGASMQFIIRNAVGVDAQIDFDEISNINESLQSTVVLQQPQLYNTINLTRATDQGGVVEAHEYSFDVNADNSNLDAFLENLPSRFKLLGDVSINPLGNVSDANDFVYTADALQARLKLDVPLRIGMQNVHISDTLYLQNDAQDVPLNGELTLWVMNAYPVGTDISLYVLENGQRIALAEHMEVASAIPTANSAQPTPAESWVNIPVTEELLAKVNENNPLLIDVVLQTPNAPGVVGLYVNQFIDFKLLVDGTYLIQYGE
jgi:hypothetical protein